MVETFRVCRQCGRPTRFTESLNAVGTRGSTHREQRQCPSCGLYVEMTGGGGGYHVTWFMPFDSVRSIAR